MHPFGEGLQALIAPGQRSAQEALFTAPDAYTRQSAGDAGDGLPDILERMDRLRIATLDKEGEEGTSTALAPRLDAQMGEARSAVFGRHAARQQDALNRRTVSEHQTLIRRAAEAAHIGALFLHGPFRKGCGTPVTGRPRCRRP